MAADFMTLPANLPVPQDDGAAGHLPGSALPALVLESSQGPVDLAELAAAGARVAGFSGQTRTEQVEFAERGRP
jgi:hypothetical protein